MWKKQERDKKMGKKTIEKNAITEGVIWKQLLIFFFPIMLGTLIQQLYTTVDTIIVGRFVGKAALASVGGPAAVSVLCRDQSDRITDRYSIDTMAA